jgi:hypothetical protein
MARPHTGHPWSKGEVNYASSLYGEVPPSVAFTDYNQWASANGYPPRTQRALIEKMCAIGVSCRCRDAWDYLPATEIAALLQISKTRIYAWRDRIGLPIRRHGGPLSYFAKRTDLVRYLLRNPHLLMGRPAAGIHWLIDDLPTAERLAALPRYRKGNMRHYAGGLRFNSLKDLHAYFSLIPQ